MRIVCISDTHTKHWEMNLYNTLPEGDVLIHAGDLSNRGSQWDIEDFIDWFSRLDGFKYKIFIAGNHDHCFEKVNLLHRNGDYEWFDGSGIKGWWD